MESLESVLKKYEDLIDVGFTNPKRGESDVAYKARIVDGRLTLIRSFGEIEAAITWIELHLEMSPKICRISHSYGLKHYAEKEAGYTSNGVFIAAMLMCEYECERCSPDSPNAFFNISPKIVKALKKEYYAR
jgi:hypothetical protein